ncbi:family 14 glycosylhydrolase [Lachnoclostridium sp.]|uniref:family 14 glycosylhydrolase n=1 Tax=Lachnoclostridium sp. TaxID=2028282 RepID=UPI00289EDF62|nr:family 14 glycosylhydrolase [Lachnoclostridium sp.]
MELCSGMKEVVICGIPFGTEGEREALKRAKETGATAIQVYTFWKDFEPLKRGLYDWSKYDREVNLILDAGLKYVPFILMGPKYAAPNWWLNSKEHKGLSCLEHQKISLIESIWNIEFRNEITRVLEAFANHYLPMKVLESIQPGISGDYGEAIFPVHGNWPGDYHTHQGYWCGDQDAKDSFRRYLLLKYKEIDKLNVTWRSHYVAIGEIEPFLPHRAPSRDALLDMLEWYRGSMTEYAEYWLKECRRIFPNTPVYLCTGGTEEPEHGASFSSQAKIAAKYQCGLRLTNEGNKFYDNFVWTAFTKSACEFYGAYLGLEPVGPVTNKGVATRIFSSAAFGNRQIFHYYTNLFDDDNNPLPAAGISKKYSGLIAESKMSKAIAFFWPGYMATLNGGIPESVKKSLIWMRRRCNCMPVNEEMILDGALNSYRLLVISISGFTSKEVLKKIAAWVNEGGVLVAAGNMSDIDLMEVLEYNALFGITRESEEVAGHCTQVISDHNEFTNLSTISQFSATKAWMNLHTDTVLLSVSMEDEGYSGTIIRKCSSTFYKRTGNGIAIYYNGPISFEEDKEAMFLDQGAFRLLLQDVMVQYSYLEDLTPNSNEVARAMIQEKVYVLTEDGEIIEE